MDTIVLYVTPYTESVFIYVSPNTMQNLARCSLEECCPSINIEEKRKEGRASEREKEMRKRKENKLYRDKDGLCRCV